MSANDPKQTFGPQNLGECPLLTEAAVQSSPRRSDEFADLRHTFERPQMAQETIHAMRRQVLMRHRTEFFFHLAVGHRILEVPSVVLDTNSLALARLQDDFEFTQIKFVLAAVSFV